ncbi:MAG: GtrA family protein [Pseudomonadota bacterium]
MAPFRAATRSHETKIRFLLSGAVNTLLGLAIFPALMLTLGRRGVHYMAILAISQVIMVTVAYLSAKFLVFRTRGAYFREFARFSTFYAASFALNLAALPLLVEVFHVRPIIAQSGFAVAIILTSYLWHSRVTFRPKGPGQ